MFTFPFIYMSKNVELFSECCFTWKSVYEMFVVLLKQILMNVKNCLDFAKEENVSIHLGASSVSVHQGTIWMKRLECAMVCSLHLTSLLLLFLERYDKSICRRINLPLKRNATRPSNVKLKVGKLDQAEVLHWKREISFLVMFEV